MTSGWSIIDFVSILPFYLSFVVNADLRVLLFLRLLRFFKLARYSAGMRTIISVLEAEKRALLADVFEASDALASKLSLADLRSLLHS